MTRRTTVLLVLSLIFTVVNVVGLGMAVAGDEGPHAAIHVALALLGAFFLWRLAPRRVEPAFAESELGERLAQLEQSVGAVAVEVERIGEGQRFVTRALADAGARAAEPAAPQDGAPARRGP